jgi:hypothetical protein
VNNIKMDLREIGWDGTDWIDLDQDRGPVKGDCEHGNECWEVLEELYNWQLMSQKCEHVQLSGGRNCQHCTDSSRVPIQVYLNFERIRSCFRNIRSKALKGISCSWHPKQCMEKDFRQNSEIKGR